MWHCLQECDDLVLSQWELNCLMTPVCTVVLYWPVTNHTASPLTTGLTSLRGSHWSETRTRVTVSWMGRGMGTSSDQFQLISTKGSGHSTLLGKLWLLICWAMNQENANIHLTFSCFQIQTWHVSGEGRWNMISEICICQPPLARLAKYLVQYWPVLVTTHSSESLNSDGRADNISDCGQRGMSSIH